MLRLMMQIFFFFSSRRRHTRCSRDWSSDVCSSDLAGRLLDAGYSLVVHDAREAAAEPLRARGAIWAASPAEVGAAAPTVITILPTSREVRQVLTGPKGLLH